MKVLTLRTAQTLPAAYQGVAEFYVRIAGEKFLCNSLSDAQRATAYFPQETTVTFMSADVDAVKSVIPVVIPGKGWDVRTRYADGREVLLCGGTGPYTLAQAQVAADSVRRELGVE